MNHREDHSEAALSKIAPILDEAVNQLPSEDRNAILLRFFEQQPNAAVGEFLGTTEEAARKRVDRALNKLQGWLRGQGVVLTVTSLTGYLLNQTVIAAPLGLALTILSQPVFAAQEAALQEKVRELLGPEALAQYQEFSRNLGSHLTAIQFEPLLSGEKSEREKKGKQLYLLLREETQATLQSQGLPADFQIVPTLNFRNIASESEGEKNLKMLVGIMERAAQRAGGFLSPDEIKKFDEFRNQALAANRMGLTMNRKLMAPAGR